LALVDLRREDSTAKVAVDGWGEVQAGIRKAGPVLIDVSGDQALRLPPGIDECEMTYGGGPVFTGKAGKAAEGRGISILGRYQTETFSFAFQRGTLIRTPAITFSKFYGGKVVLFSPHPEWTERGQLLLMHAVVLAAK
jgi:hypothetical protein